MTVAISQKAPRAGRASDPNCVRMFRRWQWEWFAWYSARYLRRRFHAVRLLGGDCPTIDDSYPLIVFLNHPGWYDPLVGMVLAKRFFDSRRHFAPIDAAALGRYAMLSRLGFFGIARGQTRGARDFLQIGNLLLDHPSTALWVTPQGHFSDVRERPTRFQPGLGHLVSGAEKVALLPLAIEYPFWTESAPEALVAFGDVTYVDRALETEPWSPAQWTEFLEEKLTRVQDRLAQAAVRRSGDEFETLICGKSGVGGIYDLWRRTVSFVVGSTFDAGHEGRQR
jgi:1-acyl-sn-glycerol-3-phosphate acyltransferase